MRLNSAVSIYRETVTVDPDRVILDGHVALYQREVNLERFRIPC